VPIYSIIGGADAALFSINAAGVLTFSTAPNFEIPADAGVNNIYDVTVQVSDGNGGVDTQAIAITVTNVNEAPVITSNGGAASAAISVAENQTAVTTVSSSDVDGGAPAYSIIGGADQGLFSINTAGVLTFNTAPNFEIPTDAGVNNVYNVTVQVADGNGGVDTQTIAITVTNVNEAPVISSNGGAATATVNAAENQTAVTTVTSTDVDGGAPVYSIVGGADQALFSINAAGVLTFSTAPNFEIPTDAGGNNVYDVTVQVADGNGGVDTQAIAITVTNVNEAPLNTVPVTQSTNEDTPLVFSSTSGNALVINDVDAGANPVRVTLIGSNGTLTLNGITNLSFNTGDGTADATMTFTGSIAAINVALNGLTFVPATGFSGFAGLIISTNDQGNSGSGGALSDTDSVTINVGAVNAAPVNTVPAAQNTNEDAVLTFSTLSGNALLINDIDAFANPVQVTLSSSNGTLTLNSLANLSFSAGDGSADTVMTFTGTIFNINAALNGLTFAPAANFNGAASLTIVTNDQGNTGAGGPLTDTGTVAININPVNDAPIASPITLIPIAEDSGARTITTTQLLTGVTDIDNAPAQLTITALSINSGNGTLVNNNDGTWTYTPALNDDSAVSFNYTVSDGGLTASSTATLDITPVNDAPVAVNDTLTTNQNTATTYAAGQLLGNDTDIEGAALTIASVTSATGGSAVLNANGSVTFTPNANFSGAASFGYTATDGSLAGNPATVTVNVVTTQNNQPVIGGDTTGTVTEDAAPVLSTAGALTISDADPGQSAFIASGVTGNYGTFTIDTAGNWRYSADDNQAAIQQLAAGATLTETFAVRSADLTTQNVVITIAGVNDAPVAADQNVSIADNGSYVLKVSDLHFTDSDGDKLVKVRVTALPNDGMLMLGNNAVALNQEVLAADIAAGNLRFVPRTGIPVQETTAIGFQVNDGTDYSANHTLSVVITPSNAPAPAPAPQVVQSNQPPESPAVADTASPDAVAKTTRAAADGENGNDRLKKQIADTVASPPSLLNESASARSGTPQSSGFAETVSVRNGATGRGIQLGAITFNVEGATAPINIAQLRQAEAVVAARTAAATANTAFLGELDQLRKNVQAEGALERNIVVSSVAAGAGMSVGYVLWLLRGGLLLSSLLSSLPAWRFVDPLPVLGRLGNDDDDENDEDYDSLESLVRAGDRAEPASSRKTTG
jgi:VCBS repeat-containing protein